MLHKSSGEGNNNTLKVHLADNNLWQDTTERKVSGIRAAAFKADDNNNEVRRLNIISNSQPGKEG